MSNVNNTTEFEKSSTYFIVKNIAPRGKTIQVFRYPILNQRTRDLLAIPYISEADIRHSLLKGELMMKIRNKEIEVVYSDIDLLQFNPDQRTFLQKCWNYQRIIYWDGSTRSQHCIWRWYAC